jgi:hypothetical protein
MPALVAGIHAYDADKEDVDGRDFARPRREGALSKLEDAIAL